MRRRTPCEGGSRWILLCLLLLATPSAAQESAEPPEDEALHEAVIGNDLEKVALLVANGADVNARLRGDGWTPLHYAVTKPGLEMMSLLIASGADVNGTDDGGFSVLMHAAAAVAELPALRLLLEHGADASAVTDYKGHDAVYHAAYVPPKRLGAYGKTEDDLVALVRALLDAGADADRGDRHYDERPLLLAARNGFPRLVEVLLDAGADVNHQTTSFGLTALMEAARRGHARTVEVLLSAGADPTLEDRLERRAAHWGQDFAEVRQLLAAAGVHTKTPMRETSTSPQARSEALAFLAERGYAFDAIHFHKAGFEDQDLEVVQAFLAAGMSPEVVRSHSTSTLLIRMAGACGEAATERSNTSLRERLEQYPERFDFAPGEGPKYRSAAAATAIALYLIESGADVNRSIDNGLTPLLMAVSDGPMELIEALIAAGADVDARSAGGSTPLMRAQIHGRQDVVALLVDHGAVDAGSPPSE